MDISDIALAIEKENEIGRKIVENTRYIELMDFDYFLKQQEYLQNAIAEQYVYDNLGLGIKKIPSAVLVYYDAPVQQQPVYDTNYALNLNGVMVRRVPRQTLGHGVLGRAWLGTNNVEILDTLDGNDFLEVLVHEVNHINNPWMYEGQIREKTRNELWFTPRYH